MPRKHNLKDFFYFHLDKKVGTENVNTLSTSNRLNLPNPKVNARFSCKKLYMFISLDSKPFRFKPSPFCLLPCPIKNLRNGHCLEH